MAIHGQNDNDINGDFIRRVGDLVNRENAPFIFTFGNVRRLDLNNNFIYLWQDVKGQVSYCFELLDKEYFTTSAAKLGNVLSSHFQTSIEVMNNHKEQLKRITSATIGLSKAVSDLGRHEEYAAYSERGSQSQNLGGSHLLVNGTQQESSISPDGVLDLLDMNTPQMQPVEQQHPLHDQKQLYQGVIQLSTYHLESNLQTIVIIMTELPVVAKKLFRPGLKWAFFSENGLNYKNSYIPSIYQVNPWGWPAVNNSSILLLIFYMAKRDPIRAMNILRWLVDSCYSLKKSGVVLVLHSEADVYMKLLYEEIIVPLVNIEHCEKINNENLDEKSLSSLLDKKVIYNFHNVTTPTISDEPASAFTNRLIHKDTYKLKSKLTTTVANMLITSTTHYIPLIDKDVESIVIPVESSLDGLCKKLNINANYYAVVKLIENDLDNFMHILRSIDMHKLCTYYPLKSYGSKSKTSKIMDCDTDALEVFNHSIMSKDVVLFKTLEAKKPRIYRKLIDDFSKDRVDRKNLLEYFMILFGEGTYKSNRALILDLRELSDSKEPFGNVETFNNNGSVYYRLN